MGLEVIGAGFGRTGTLSLKAALERLGFERCYHMYEVMQHLEHTATWVAASRGERVDFDGVFDGYRATVDWPACVFWRELMAAYPDAKVLLSVRPPERWFASFHDTIYQVMTRPTPAEIPAEFASLVEMANEVVATASFGVADLTTLSDEEMVAAYERHNAAVRDGVPAHRFLEFDVSEGWEPLCRFLGVPVPDEPFPNVNDRAMFRQLFSLDDDEPPQSTPDEVADRFRQAGAT